jgi:hypothetical protein
MDERSGIEILIEDEDLVVRPGQNLRGGFRAASGDPVHARKAELSVLWYTEGKGTEDMGVVFHQTVAENRQLDAQDAFPFEVKMPDSPWSYDGKILKIRWAVRVRLQPDHGKEIAGEQRFFLLPEGVDAPPSAGDAGQDQED